ncbi:protein adenylyltransferase Fic [Hermetia illucens]|nr:protein adenylyltransferase Fic [Hermetia illucens]XP_037911555.1 protein adenylyltransferase Fic [Hermetia illucens]
MIELKFSRDTMLFAQLHKICNFFSARGATSGTSCSDSSSGPSPRMPTSCCFFIFFSGALCSVVVFFLLNHLNFLKHSQISHYPDARYLQVRDDFSLFDPAEFDLHGGVPPGKQTLPARRHKIKSGDVKEALGTLKMALELRMAGKDDKALRLFQHALALAPKHPEVLVKFGEYLEHNKKDIVMADQMYFQALAVNPTHSDALMNRQRTAHIVETIDANRLALLETKRNALSGINESNSALRRAKKEAYFQHIYHSVGIEGNTMTLAQTRSIIETRMAIDGKSIDEHNEILGLDAAMKFINDTLVNKNDYITLKDILEIHRRVLGNVDPIEGGEFRRTQVYVGGHVPPGPGDLGILLRHFENWLNSERALSMHPVKYAAVAHYKLVHIHPFTDGNGRTSRLLMNTILMRAGYPPVIIPKQQRHKYYDFLQLANEGDIRPFVRFIADCTEKTLDLYLWATSELTHQIPMLAPTEFENSSSVEESAEEEQIAAEPQLIPKEEGEERRTETKTTSEPAGSSSGFQLG